MWNNEEAIIHQRMKVLLEDEDTLERIQVHTKELVKLMSYYRCAMMEIETKFKVLNEEKVYRCRVKMVPIKLKGIENVPTEPS